jgi:hypothetical protein
MRKQETSAGRSADGSLIELLPAREDNLKKTKTFCHQILIWWQFFCAAAKQSSMLFK